MLDGQENGTLIKFEYISLMAQLCQTPMNTQSKVTHQRPPSRNAECHLRTFPRITQNVTSVMTLADPRGWTIHTQYLKYNKSIFRSTLGHLIFSYGGGGRRGEGGLGGSFLIEEKQWL